MQNSRTVNKKSVGILIIFLDICIHLFIYGYYSKIEVVNNYEFLNILYFGKSKLFIIGLLLILIGVLEDSKNKQ